MGSYQPLEKLATSPMPGYPIIIVPGGREFAHHNLRDTSPNTPAYRDIEIIDPVDPFGPDSFVTSDVKAGTAEEWKFLNAAIHLQHVPECVENEIHLWFHDDTYCGRPIDWKADAYRGHPYSNTSAEMHYPHPLCLTEFHDTDLPVRLLNVGDPMPQLAYYFLGSGGLFYPYPPVAARTKVWLPWAEFYNPPWVHPIIKSPPKTIAYGKFNRTELYMRYAHQVVWVRPKDYDPNCGIDGYITLKKGGIVRDECIIGDYSLFQNEKDGLHHHVIYGMFGEAYGDYYSNNVNFIDIGLKPPYPRVGGHIPQQFPPEQNVWRTGQGWVTTSGNRNLPLSDPTNPLSFSVPLKPDDYAYLSTTMIWKGAEIDGHVLDPNDPGDWIYYTYNIAFASMRGSHSRTPGGIDRRSWIEFDGSKYVSKSEIQGGEIDSYTGEIVDPILTRDEYGRRWPPIYGTTSGINAGGSNFDKAAIDYGRERLYKVGAFKSHYNADAYVRNNETMTTYRNELTGQLLTRPIWHFFQNDYPYPTWMGTHKFGSLKSYKTPTGGFTCNIQKAFDLYDEWKDQLLPRKDRGKRPIDPLARRPLEGSMKW